MRFGFIGVGLIPTPARPTPTTAPENVVLPSISGIQTQGQTLTANPGSWLGMPSGLYAYQWQRNGSDIGSATNATYVVQGADVGANITVEVTATNDIGSTMAESAAVVPAATLTITGTPPDGIVGVSYTFTPGGAGGHAPKSYALTGTLPAGLSFNTSTGAITGTPLADETAGGLNITVTDDDGLTASLGVFDIDVTAATVPGQSPTTFSTTPAVHYHPNSQSGGAGYTKDGNQVTACPSLGSLAAAMSGIGVGGVTIGPRELTDALGRKFWRFNGAEYAIIANALVMASSRGFSVVMVGRTHHQRNTQMYLNPRYATFTDGANNTFPGSAVGWLRGTVVSGQSAPFLQGGSPQASANATDCYKVIPGCQLHVAGIASRTTANGGTRLFMNNDTCDTAQQTSLVTNYVGALIGAQSTGANNTEAVTTSVNNTFDIYELAIWQGELSNATANANQAAAVTNYAVTALTRQVVLEGDSITDGVHTPQPVTPAWAGGIGSQMSEPGSSWVPADTRVINMGASGNQTSHIATKRDGTNAIYSAGKYPGGHANNIIALQIGRNDAGVQGPAGTGVPSTIYAAIVALWNTTTTGFLQRGWSGFQMGNIASSTSGITGSPPDAPATVQGRIEALRALLFTGTGPNATFLSDTLTGVGQTYEGRLGCIPVHEITVSGDTAFKTSTDASDVAAGWYDSSPTHLVVAGIGVMLSGGDNPAYGYGAVL